MALIVHILDGDDDEEEKDKSTAPFEDLPADLGRDIGEGGEDKPFSGDLD